MNVIGCRVTLRVPPSVFVDQGFIVLMLGRFTVSAGYPGLPIKLGLQRGLLIMRVGQTGSEKGHKRRQQRAGQQDNQGRQ